MNRVSIVMYHYVRDLNNSRYPAIKGLDFELFRQQIDFFAAHFNVITIEEVIAAYDEGYELPQNALLLTFDDGYIDHYLNVFPLLQAYKMQGSFFIPGKTFCDHVLL
ncbi:MAG: polysaccharide deacetylase family protein, partial [Eubacteriales bacterium]